MALYLGSEGRNGRGRESVVPGRAKREPGPHNHRIAL